MPWTWGIFMFSCKHPLSVDRPSAVFRGTLCRGADCPGWPSCLCPHTQTPACVWSVLISYHCLEPAEGPRDLPVPHCQGFPVDMQEVLISTTQQTLLEAHSGPGQQHHHGEWTGQTLKGHVWCGVMTWGARVADLG